jgi:hypothetical protein
MATAIWCGKDLNPISRSHAKIGAKVGWRIALCCESCLSQGHKRNDDDCQSISIMVRDRQIAIGVAMSKSCGWRIVISPIIRWNFPSGYDSVMRDLVVLLKWQPVSLPGRTTDAVVRQLAVPTVLVFASQAWAVR